MDKQVIDELLSSVHKYYPIGLPMFWKSYSGYESFLKIVSNKIEGENVQWKAFLSDTRDRFSFYTVTDLSYIQFPNYKLEIEVESFREKDFKISRSIVVTISLLVNYFTIYAADSYRLTDDSTGGGPLAPTIEVFYHNSSKKKIYLDYMEFLNSLVKQHFSSHQFLGHKSLFLIRLTGCGTYADMTTYQEGDSRSFYEYLFDSNIVTEPHILD